MAEKKDEERKMKTIEIVMKERQNFLMLRMYKSSGKMVTIVTESVVGWAGSFSWTALSRKGLWARHGLALSL